MEPEHPEFRVTKLHLENFKSCRSTTLELGDFTCLVGPNNSGKTNILEGMRFLRTAFKKGLGQAVSDFGGTEKLRHYGAQGDPIVIKVEAVLGNQEIVYEVALGRDGWLYGENLSLAHNGRPLQAILDSENRGGALRVFLYDAQGRQTLLQQGSHNELLIRSAAGRSPICRQFLDHVIAWRSYRFSPDLLKAVGPAMEAPELERDGRNFASFVHSVQSRHRRVFARIEEQLIKSFPEIDELVSPLVGTQTVVGVRERWFEHPIEGSNLSDGLVGFLAHLVAFYGPEKPTLLIFEEPENYVHARLMERLVNMLRESSKSTQTIITTHSVTLLNSLEPRDIRVVTRADGNTITNLIGQESTLEQALSSMGLGDLYFSGELGGVPN